MNAVNIYNFSLNFVDGSGELKYFSKNVQAYQAHSGQCVMVGQHCGGDKLMNLCITQQTIHLGKKPNSYH